MNLKQFLHLLIGLVWILIGVYLAYVWSKEFLIVIKGALPWVLFFVGVIWALIGYVISEDIEENLEDFDQEEKEEKEEENKEKESKK